jgi:hypothetical protein
MVLELFCRRTAKSAGWTSFKVAQESTLVPCNVLVAVFLRGKAFVEILAVDSWAFEQIWPIKFLQYHLLLGIVGN